MATQIFKLSRKIHEFIAVVRLKKKQIQTKNRYKQKSHTTISRLKDYTIWQYRENYIYIYNKCGRRGS